MSSFLRLDLPDWALHVAAGANLAFDVQVHICHASSPAHAEQELHLCLNTGKQLPVPGAKEQQDAADLAGLQVKRVQVRPSFHGRSTTAGCWVLAACAAMRCITTQA